MTKAHIQDSARHQLGHLPVHRVVDMVVETMLRGFLLIFVDLLPGGKVFAERRLLLVEICTSWPRLPYAT